MEQYQYFLLLSIMTSYVAVLSSQYIYVEKQGSLIGTTEMNFSVSIERFEGIVIYGVDKDYKFRIKFREMIKNAISMEINMNNSVHYVNVQELCGCTNCPQKNLTFFIKPRPHEISVQCNNKETILIKRNSRTYQKDSFSNYPNPRDLSNNKTYILMGNIGPYVDTGNVTTYPDKTQLHGCLNWFFVNRKILTFSKGSNQFVPTCIKNITETIINRTKSVTNEKAVHIFDCSITVLNEKFCKQNMEIHFGGTLSFIRTKLNSKSFKLILYWKPLFIKEMCLLEIKLRDKSTLTFSVDSRYKIIVQKSKYSSNDYRPSVIDAELSPNNISALSINFIRPHVIVKIFSNEKIYTRIEDFVSEPDIINVGFSEMKGRCSNFQGALDFKFDQVQFTPVRSTDSTKPTEQSLFMKYQAPLIIFGVFVGFFILLGILYLIIRKEIYSSIEQRPIEENNNKSNRLITFDSIHDISSPLKRQSSIYEIVL